MTKADNPTSQSKLVATLRTILAGVCAIGAISVLAYTTGFTMGTLADSHFNLRDALIVGGALVGAALLGGLSYVLARSELSIPAPKSVRKYRKLMILAGILGMVIGGTLAYAIVQSGTEVFLANPAGALLHGPIPLWAAIVAIICWAIGLPLLMWSYWKTIDEHDYQANSLAANVGISSYIIATPVWWIGWRGGFLPPVEPMITWLAILLIFSGVWTYFRYR